MKNNHSGIFNFNNKNQNIYIIGDIHGDYQCFIHCMVDLCKVTSISKIYNDVECNYNNREYLEWNHNNNSVVVFCGDIIHRKRFIDHVLDDECSDVYLLNTILRLKKAAEQYGGNIILIAGNHEIMNLVTPDEQTYTSKLNFKMNMEYFTNSKTIKEFINNSFAWIKINDILITHGGLCSEYLDYFENNTNKFNLKDNSIIKYVNNKYLEYFENFDYKNIDKNTEGYELFIEYNIDNKKKHNMFWCREWGYSGINCDKYDLLLKKVDCKKMIIAHCPQFLSPDQPKMINFDCANSNQNSNQNSNLNKSNEYNLARIDLGMSRSFEYNKEKNFIYYLNNNYHRKIAILKLLIDNDNNLYFNNSSIITLQLSCIQYLLLKYGLDYKDWINKNICSNWIGFKYIQNVIAKLNDNNFKNSFNNCKKLLNDTNIKINDNDTIVMCLLYPIFKSNSRDIQSINEFNQFNKLSI